MANVQVVKSLRPMLRHPKRHSPFGYIISDMVKDPAAGTKPHIRHTVNNCAAKGSTKVRNRAPHGSECEASDHMAM